MGFSFSCGFKDNNANSITQSGKPPWIKVNVQTEFFEIAFNPHPPPSGKRALCGNYSGRNMFGFDFENGYFDKYNVQTLFLDGIMVAKGRHRNKKKRFLSGIARIA